MTTWTWNQTDEITYLYLPDWLEQGAFAAFTTRTGGSSNGAYDSLNLALHVGDDPLKVVDNRVKTLNSFGGSLDMLVCSQQVHSSRAAAVDSSYRGRGAFEYEDGLPDTDALATDTPGLYLASFYADCIPVYMFDPDHRCVALIHSGWKGTMNHIAAKTFTLMKEQYGSSIRRISVFIGPGIDRCCFEVHSDLAAQASNEFAGFTGIIDQRGGQLYWDLKGTIQRELLLLGAPAENVQVCPLCTCCRGDLFYSYRRDNGNTGRMGAFLTLR